MNSKVAILVFISVLLISCTPETPTQENTVEAIGVTTETPVTEVRTTQEPIVIKAPTATTPGVTFLELPVWLNNPSNQIVLFVYDIYSTRPSRIGFFNAASGEQAIIRLPFEIYEYYWKDTNHIEFLQGYCDEPLVGVTELDISQGTLSPATAENLPEYIASCYGLEAASATIQINTSSSEPTVEMLDPTSGTWLPVTDPNDEISDINFALSPNNDYLGIVQIQGKYDFPELWQPLFGTQVSVYHLPDQKRVATFAEDKDVSEMLLFADNENLVYVRDNTPCVISIATVSKKCIQAISDRFPESIIILGDPLKDRNKLSFLYFDNSPHQGGWCIYDLFSGALDCPTDEFEDLQGQIVVNYALSPDNNYLLVEYDDKGCPVPWCDYFGGPQTAVIDIAGKKFFKLGGSDTYQTMDIFRETQPWRPAP
jgi:hypothetical protein